MYKGRGSNSKTKTDPSKPNHLCEQMSCKKRQTHEWIFWKLLEQLGVLLKMNQKESLIKNVRICKSTCWKLPFEWYQSYQVGRILWTETAFIKSPSFLLQVSHKFSNTLTLKKVRCSKNFIWICLALTVKCPEVV